MRPMGLMGLMGLIGLMGLMGPMGPMGLTGIVLCHYWHGHCQQGVIIGLDEAFAFAGALVDEQLMIDSGRRILKVDADIIEINILDLAGHIAANEAGVGADGGDVVEPDVAHIAAATFCLSLGEAPVLVLVVAAGTWVGGHVDGLCLAPPHIAPQAEVHVDVGEHHVGHGALVAILYAEAAVGAGDDAVVEQHVVDGVHVLRANLDGTRARGHGAVGDHNVVAGAVLLKLAAVLQADAVVAAGDVTVGNAHVFRVVQVDAVAIAYLQVVQEVDAIDDGAVAANEVDCPVGPLADGDIADDEIVAIGQRQHMWPGVECRVSQGFQLVTVVQFGTHELNAVAMDGAAAGDAQVVGTVSPEPHHALATVLTEGAQVVDMFVGVGQQRGGGLQMEFHVGLQLHGAAQKGVIAGQQHTASALFATAIDGLLQSHSIVSQAVALGTIIQHIIRSLGLQTHSHPQ